MPRMQYRTGITYSGNKNGFKSAANANYTEIKSMHVKFIIMTLILSNMQQYSRSFQDVRTNVRFVLCPLMSLVLGRTVGCDLAEACSRRNSISQVFTWKQKQTKTNSSSLLTERRMTTQQGTYISREISDTPCAFPSRMWLRL